MPVAFKSPPSGSHLSIAHQSFITVFTDTIKYELTVFKHKHQCIPHKFFPKMLKLEPHPILSKKGNDWNLEYHFLIGHDDQWLERIGQRKIWRKILRFIAPGFGGFSSAVILWGCKKSEELTWQIRFPLKLTLHTAPPTRHPKSDLKCDPAIYSLFVAGGDNWAKKYEKQCSSSSLYLQLLPQNEKAQSVTPQTTKYIYIGQSLF